MYVYMAIVYITRHISMAFVYSLQVPLLTATWMNRNLADAEAMSTLSRKRNAPASFAIPPGGNWGILLYGG